MMTTKQTCTQRPRRLHKRPRLLMLVTMVMAGGILLVAGPARQAAAQSPAALTPAASKAPAAAPGKPAAAAEAGLSPEQLRELIALVDDRQRNAGDYSSLVTIQQKDKDGSEKAFEARVYRRDSDDKWMILFVKPKTEAGKGYLRLEKNLFLYEPALGKWERQTERASIGGTNSRRDDFDESRLADEYDAQFVDNASIGQFKTHHVKLTAKKGVDVASPVVDLWIDQASKNVLKRQEFALSGKLLRTSLYPSWEKMFSKSKGADVYVPREIYVFDEIEKGASTAVKLGEVKLDALPANMFTKAWLESQSK